MNYTFDHGLFMALNFDGGPRMDYAMELVSGTAMWIPLYIAIFAAVWYRFGWRSALGFIVCLALAMGLSDMVCGIFKHSGLLKNLWGGEARPRPMWTKELIGHIHVPSYAHGRYGTVSAHAATVAALAMLSSLTFRKGWYTAFIWVISLVICYSRIYKACHFPMDILLGLAVGAVLGWLMWLLWKKLDKIFLKYGA